MTKFTVYDAKTWGRLGGRLTLVFGLAAAVFAYGVTEARAEGRAYFSDPNTPVQMAALTAHEQVVGSEDLSHERAKGFTPATLSAPGDDSKVAVILWDDAWSELQRRARSASAASTVGSNVGTSIAGSSGAGSN